FPHRCTTTGHPPRLLGRTRREDTLLPLLNESCEPCNWSSGWLIRRGTFSGSKADMISPQGEAGTNLMPFCYLNYGEFSYPTQPLGRASWAASIQGLLWSGLTEADESA